MANVTDTLQFLNIYTNKMLEHLGIKYTFIMRNYVLWEFLEIVIV